MTLEILMLCGPFCLAILLNMLHKSPSFWVPQGRLGFWLSLVIWSIMLALVRNDRLSVPRCTGLLAPQAIIPAAISALVELPPSPMIAALSTSPLSS